MTTRNFEGPIVRVGEKLFEFVGVLGMADAIAEQDRAGLEVSRLPRVQEMVRGRERKHVTGVGGNGLFCGMAVRSSPDRSRQKDCQKEKTCCEPNLHAKAVRHSSPMFLASDDVTLYSTGKRTERQRRVAKFLGSFNECNRGVTSTIEAESVSHSLHMLQPACGITSH